MGHNTGGDRLAALEDQVAQLVAKDHIRSLAATYQRACDGGWDRPTHGDPEFLTSLFTDDASYFLPHLGEANGSAEIRDMFVRLQPIPWIIHFLANDILRVDGDTASGEFKCAAVLVQDGERIFTFGTYAGTFHRVDGEWKFSSWHFHRAQQPESTPGAIPAT
ncbi:MAG: nuclear transport factor 2 family protein [Aeromicrobium sp.]